MSENNGRGGRGGRGREREEKERGREEKENRRERGEKERRLGKGLAAIISQTDEVISEEVRSNKEEVRIGEVRSEELISNKLEDAVMEATRNPRISLWSPKSAAVLRYLRKTVPEFSISEEARSLLEDAIKRKYGKIWEEVERRLK
ncbi:MAG: hypothetical protein N2V78_11505 [Methanophagales archaeon]|nr:hypothetical protein [Methanophagales archaeon]